MGPLFIREYRVSGAKKLGKGEIEEAVYPFLGPGRGPEDVEQARAALEKAFRGKGYQTVSVQVPDQDARHGVVMLQVVEAPVGRLRVRDSRYFSLNRIKKDAPSLAEGTVPDFNQVTRDIVALNQLPDRQVTPSLRAGVEPGTVDVDLTVKDKFPLHGSVELNNRYSPDTSPLRLSGSVNYNNLWQLGHSIGFSAQIAPEDINEVQVYSGYYIARIPRVSWFSLLVQGTKQDSNVSTLGGIAVAGRGEVVGARAIISLPVATDFYHSFNLGFDYKHFNQDVTIAGTEILTPITYYPFSATYSATWAGKGRTTELNAGVVFHVRGLGGDPDEFANNRFGADGSFIYTRGSIAHSHDLPRGFQVFGKLQGQLADQPLVNSEQYTGGGLGTVRGYLESETLGDNAILGSLEFRTPSLGAWLGKRVNDWRFYAFAEGGVLTLHDPLPEQESEFHLASVGAGTRIRLFDHVSGSLDLGFPLVEQAQSSAGDVLLVFRVGADF